MFRTVFIPDIAALCWFLTRRRVKSMGWCCGKNAWNSYFSSKVWRTRDLYSDVKNKKAVFNTRTEHHHFGGFKRERRWQGRPLSQNLNDGENPERCKRWDTHRRCRRHQTLEVNKTHVSEGNLWRLKEENQSEKLPRPVDTLTLVTKVLPVPTWFQMWGRGLRKLPAYTVCQKCNHHDIVMT